MGQVTPRHKSDILRSVSRPKVMIALGANIDSVAGPPARTLAAALDRLGDSQLTVEAVSPFYATPCFPPGAGPDYVNAAARLTGLDDPDEILAILHRVESEFGRARDRRWGTRTLDLDLLAVGDMVLPDPATFREWQRLPPERQMMQAPDRLILPHPRLQDRAFVLVPLASVAGEWRHPVLNRTVDEMLRALPGALVADVRPLDPGASEPPR